LEEIVKETDFGIITLTTEELLALPIAERDFLLAASFIINDLRFYWSMMARSPIDASGDNLRTMQLIRQLWTIRKLASVIHEAHLTLSGFCTKWDLVKEAVQSDLKIIEKAESRSKMKDVAHAFRNMSAHHFSNEGLGFDLANFDFTSKHRIFAHVQTGNSISEIGEQIFTISKLKEIAPEGTINDLHDWCMKCSGSIMSFCNVITAKIITRAFPNKRYFIESVNTEMEAYPKEHRWPLFLVV
jgi:hypothetical protein